VELRGGLTFRAIALCVVSFAFVAAGFVILPRNRNLGVVSVTFFGAVTLVHTSTLLRRVRHARLQPLRAHITGGVWIRPSRKRAGIVGTLIAVPGAVMLLFDPGFPWRMRALALLLCIVGTLLLVGIALRWLPRNAALMFTPEGVVFGSPAQSFTIPWDAMSVQAAEAHDNAALLIWITPIDAVRVDPKERRDRVVKGFVTNSKWVGAHQMLLTEPYGLDLPLLVVAMQRYISAPASRVELNQSASLPSANAR
jgi:hypothetical protein